MSGIMYESFSWIYKVVITLVVAAAAIWIVGGSIANDINTYEVQKQLLISRVLYSPESIWYTDDSGMLHPGVVDAANFNQERMDAGFEYPDRYGGAKLSLVRKTGEENIYIEKETYTFYKNQFENRIRGGGHAETHLYPVVIRTGEQMENGYLILEVALPERT